MTKPKKEQSATAQVLLGSSLVTIPQLEGKEVVYKTFELVPYSDLPRKTRRELRNSLFKAAPQVDSASDKADIYLSAYDAGLVALRAAGAQINPNDESMDADLADELDQTIMVVGIRVLGEMNSGGSDNPKDEPGDEPGDEPWEEAEKPKEKAQKKG